MRFFIIIGILSAGLLAQAENIQELLKASDLGRGGMSQGLTWNTKVETKEDGETAVREFLVKAKGNDAQVSATQPARNKGEIYLFNDRNMWFFKASLKKPVPISARQKLSGQAANGDIASTQYARDYNPTFEKKMNLNGEPVQVLLLKSKSPNLTYDQIRYYISEKSKLAVKAEFLTLQGEVFKIGELEYKNSLKLNGKNIPFVSRLHIVDAKFPQNQSTILYSNPHVEDHSVSLFSVNNLSR